MLIAIATVLLLALGVLLFMANKGFVAVNLAGQSTYNITVNNSSEVALFQDFSNGSKKLINKDYYNFTIKIDDSSFVAATKTAGWLKTTSVNGKLTKELYTNQVATNPASCIIKTADITYSIDCKNGSSDLTIHHPATTDLPGYQTKTNNLYRWLGDIIFVDNQYIGLSAFVDSGYIVSTFPNGDVAVDVFTGTELSSGDDLNIKRYKEGFIVYAKNKVAAYYYKNLSSSPEKLNFSAIDGSQFNAFVYKDYITYYPEYSYGGEDTSDNPPSFVISTYNGHEYTTQDVDSSYKRPFLCGDKLICSLSSISDSFTVDNINNDAKLERKYIFFGVSDYTPYEDGLGLDVKFGLIKISPETGEGYFLTTYPENLSSCGISPISNQLSLCLIDEQNDDIYAYVLSKTPVVPAAHTAPQQPQQPIAEPGSDINKQMQELRQNDNIDVARLDGKFIYINTNVIPIVNAETGRSETDPEELQYAKDNINRNIDEIGIDRNIYTIVIL